MSESTNFIKYTGWEKDVQNLVQRYLAISPSVVEVELARWAARRLSDHFPLPKCGKALSHWTGEPIVFAYAANVDESKIVCCLPVGHHRFVSSIGSARCGMAVNGRECSASASDPIHSPGHVPDSPEGAWR